MSWFAPPQLADAATDRALRLDTGYTAGKALMQGLTTTVGVQLCIDLGGGLWHSSLIFTAAFVGLLGSGPYASWRWGGRRWRLGVADLLGVGLLCLVPLIWNLPVAEPLRADLLALLLAAVACCGGLGMPLVSGAYAALYRREERGRAVAHTRLTHGLVGVLSLLLIGRLVQLAPVSVNAVYPLCALAAGLLALRFIHILDDGFGGGRHASLGAQLRTLQRLPYGRFQLFQLVAGVANLMANPLLAVMLRERHGLSLEVAVLVGPFGVIEQIVRLTSVRLHGRLYERMGVLGHRVLTSVLSGLGFALWAFAGDVWTIALAAALLGLGRAGGQIVWLIGALEFARPGEEDDHAAAHTLLTGVRGVIAPSLGVWLLAVAFAGHDPWLLLCCAVLSLLSALGHALLVPCPSRVPPS